LSHPVILYGPAQPWATFMGDARPPGWVICFGVDIPGPWWTRSSIENPTLIGASLSNVRVIMVIMLVLVVELLCQAVTGWIPVLECLLPGARGHLRLCLVLLGIKWPCYSRTLALRPLAQYLGYLQVWLPRA
jgi:hypothetical protein